MKPFYHAIAITAFVLSAAGTATLAAAEELPKDTNRIETLTAAQAEQLVTTSTERVLALGGLKTVSKDVATALAQFDRSALRLNGLTEISPEIAVALAKSRATVLDLGGLATPSDAVLTALRDFAGQGLVLGLDALTPSTSKTLATFKARRLRLSGKAALDVEAAVALASFPGEQLWFERAPTELSPDVARAIASFKGAALGFDGLTTLSTDAAKELATFRGESLALQGIKTLSGDAAEALAAFKGRELACHSLRNAFVKLGGGAPMTLDAARLVCVCTRHGERLTLHFLSALDSPDAEEIARVLATSKGTLTMPKLKKISPRALAALTANGNMEIPARDSLELVGE